MATFKSFEEIDAWKKARELTKLLSAETARMIAGLMKYLSTSAYKGPKYKTLGPRKG